MQNRKAFTLVELLLVITLIGILVGALTKVLTGSLARARDTQRMADIRLVADFLTDKYIHTGIPLPAKPIWACLDPGNTLSIGLPMAIKNNLSYFGGRFPVDPKPSSSWNIGGTQRCPGQYLYYTGTLITCSGKPAVFPFILMAQVENSDKGNFATYLGGYNMMRCGPPSYNFAASGPVFGVVGTR